MSPWIVEVPSMGIMSELCIGKIGAMHDADEEDFKLVKLKYTIIWKPDPDDDERIGGLQLCTEKPLPEYDFMYFNKKFIQNVDDEKSLEKLAIKSVFEFNWK